MLAAVSATVERQSRPRVPDVDRETDTRRALGWGREPEAVQDRGEATIAVPLIERGLGDLTLGQAHPFNPDIPRARRRRPRAPCSSVSPETGARSPIRGWMIPLDTFHRPASGWLRRLADARSNGTRSRPVGSRREARQARRNNGWPSLAGHTVPFSQRNRGRRRAISASSRVRPLFGQSGRANAFRELLNLPDVEICPPWGRALRPAPGQGI